MERTFSFNAAQAGNAIDLGFYARSVKIQTGQNYVVLQQGYTVGPGVIGWSIPLPTPTSTAVFDVNASPSVAQGTTPLGPLAQTTTTITYTDEDLPPSPGVLLTPQSIAVIQTGSQLVGPNNQVNIIPGLAHAFTFFAITDDTSTANWSLFGQMGVGGLSPTILSSTAAATFTFAQGQGTVWTVGANFPDTQHLFPESAVICTKPFFFDLRFYY